jgi:hypothetical protein
MPIKAYLQDQVAFGPEAIAAMSQAFEETCTALSIPAHETRARQAIAARIIDLARTGVIDAKALRQRVLLEARSADQ